jgi:hypothetical protein
MITITINTENDAFLQFDTKAAEVARILEQLAGLIKRNGVVEVKLYDLNGNPVGQLEEF